MNSSSPQNRSEAATHLREKRSLILRKWETLARKEIPAAKAYDRQKLRNNIPEFLDELADTLAHEGKVQLHAPKYHAESRANLNEYTLEEVIKEYRLLKRVIFAVLETEVPLGREAHWFIEDRLDLGIEEAASRYALLTQKSLLEARQTSILHAALDAIIQMDHEGRIVEWNPSAENLFGYAREDVLGKDLANLIIPPALRDRHRRGLTRYLETGMGRIIGRRLEFPALRSDGRDLLVEMAITHILVDGSPLFTGFIKDITERKRHEEERNSILRHARCILWGAEVGRWEDENGPHLDWKSLHFDEEAAQNVISLDLLPGENYALAFWRCRHPEDNERMGEASRRAFFSGEESYRQEFRSTDRYGHEHWLHEDVSIQPLEEGRWRAAGVVTDVTERKRLEMALQERADALTEADQRKDQFLAMLAHELRNPLAPILNAVHILRNSGPKDPPLVRAREIIERQVLHQAGLINGLLDTVRIRSGRVVLQPERLDLLRLVSETTDLYRGVFAERGLSLTLNVPDSPLSVHADPTRMAQVLSNLLDNAGKYTPSGGTVSVGVSIHGSEAQIIVEDTGIGIEEAMLPRVFDTFTQADRSLDRSQGGLGLGLALVKSLVEAHGGRITVESEGLSRGACFTITLPTAAQEAVAEHVDVLMPIPLRNLQILIIEDNPDAAETLRDLLELFGHEVRAALDGPEGLKRFEETAPDVVLCDIGLPGMDGYEVARQIRQREAGRTYLIAVTGYGQAEARQKAEWAGFDRFLAKPVPPEVLVELLEGVPSLGEGSPPPLSSKET